MTGYNFRQQPMSGIYVHIPFCHSKCFYCDFFSTAAKSDLDAYIDAVAREYNRRKEEIDPTRPSTIYIGGGTPSILSPQQIGRLFDILPTDSASEITIEVNPEDVTDEFAAFLSSSPVNRVSMGVQSLDDAVLRAIGRRHSAADSLRAVERLRNAGITNLSLDLIYGLPGQTCENWIDTLDRILALHPEHLSAYSLMLEPGTRLSAMVRSGKYEETPQEVSERMYAELCRKTTETGMNHYEISNFALEGYHSRHNSAYWDMTPYLGLGPGAHSFDGTCRRSNPTRIKEYICAEGFVAETETLTNDQMIDEYLMVRLRTSSGLSLDEFCRRFVAEATKSLMNRAASEISSGRLIHSDNTLRIPENHWLVSDSILINLFC